MLARSAPPSVESSASVERDSRSCSRKVRGSSGGRSRSRSSRSRLSRAGGSREGRCRARLRSGWLHDRSRESRSRFTTRLRSRGRMRFHRGSSRSPSARVRSRRSRSRSSDRYRVRRVHSSSRSDRSQSQQEPSRFSGRCRFQRDRSQSCGSVTIRVHGTGHFSPLAGPGHGREFGGQGGVAGIVWRLKVPPKIAAALGCRWSQLLRLRAAPSLGPSLRCRTSPGCSSACRGPVNSGMRLWSLCFRLLPAPVLGLCLVPLHRCR